VAYQHVREDAKPPSLSNRDVSPAVDAIVLKALAKNPLNRYQSAAEMRADTLRAAAGRPVYAEPVMRPSDTGATQAVGRTGGPGGPRTQPARVGNKQRRKTSGWAIAALTALAVLAGVAMVAGLIVSQQPDKQAVPNLVSKTRADADKQLVDLRLVPDGKGVNGLDCTPNTVLRQSTPESTKVEVGTKVSYEFCLGPGTVQVPAVLGGQSASAIAQLKTAKLTPKTEQVDSEKPADTVIEVKPAVGTAVAEGTEVVLRISKGNLKVVPDVSSKSNLSAETARALLVQAGFPDDRIRTVTENTADPKLNGKVLHQDPAAQSIKDPTKTNVTIFVGQYDAPASTTTPSTTGTPTP
jgi:serine/threonine-protein kinase